jgi:glycosyltransferase involved in cell wall biosynthesis
MGAKIPSVAAHSSAVIAANRTLETWAREYNPRVEWIPNSLDLAPYDDAVAHRTSSRPPTIVWIATHVTTVYLGLVEEPLRTLSRMRAAPHGVGQTEPPFTFKTIGAPSYRVPGVPMVARPWTQPTEAAELASSDVGVMPVIDDEWGRGKSSLKLIQYLAAGVASVASPVGSNLEVVQPDVNGMFAATHQEWVDSLSRLLGSPDDRRRFGEAGRATAHERYSLSRNAPRLLELIREVMDT